MSEVNTQSLADQW